MTCWVKECGGSSPASDCFVGTVLCQHGDDECKADTIEGCAVKHYGSMGAADFVYCFEYSQQGKASAMTSCAQATGLDAEVIAKCVTGDDGAKVDAANAKATAALGTSKIGTPWVLVNGKALEDADSLFKTVCKSMGSRAPSACQ